MQRKSNNSPQILARKVCQALRCPCSGLPIEGRCRYVKVAKFLDDNKPKTFLKQWIHTASNFINLIQFHLIWQMLAKFSGWIRKDSI